MTYMPFGKHKGRLFREIPTDYLEWLCDNVEMGYPLEFAVLTELGTRSGRVPDTARSAEASCRTVASLEPEIRKWFAALALRWHPDRGGSQDAMRAVNDANERLRDLLRRLGLM